MTRPILINARAAARPELGGVERWAREMTTRLPQLHPERYRVITPPKRFVHRAGHLWEQTVLPLRARQEDATLLFSPANLAPLGYSKNVVVIHDAAAFHGSEWYSASYRLAQRTLLPLIARRALHVVTVSEFSKQELLRHLPLDPEKVSVISGGVGNQFSPNAADQTVLERYGLQVPYVLTVGSRTARKNLAVLERAAALLLKAGVNTFSIGGTRPQFRDRHDDDQSVVVALGPIPEADLPAIYAGAQAFVLPSLYEGFGLPCLEAMASGVPVVVADTSALPEVCSDAALYASPDDPDQFAQHLSDLINDDALHAAMAKKGLKRAANFSWGRAAQAVDELLNRIAATVRL